MKKKVSVRDRIEKFAENYNYSFREDYSGRGMFGRQCIGVSGKGDLKYELFEFLVNDGMSTSRAKQIINESNTDSMGLGIIIYFPNRQ